MQGLTTILSQFDPRETMDRLEAEIRAQGMQVFIRIDHAAGAAQAGLELTPTELIVFGSARAGTPLMQANPTMGIDLPLKAFVWQDAEGKTRLSYNEPGWLAQRHGGGGEQGYIIGRMEAALKAVVGRAAESRKI